jgi:carbon-monoxide dehydrogenase medium subunit
MLLPKFDYHAPASLSEACEVLARHNGQAKVLAGGTDLLVNMKKKLLAPKHVLSLDRLAELQGVASHRGEVVLGALVTAAELAGHPVVRKSLAPLSVGAGKLGSPLIRNRATLGGNLVTARPAADLAPPLLALGARVVLTGPSGDREVPLAEFYLGPGQTVIKPAEILTRVIIPGLQPGSGGAYEKLGLRKTLEIAIVNVAAVLTLNAKGDKVASARLVLGAVAPTPIRAFRAEKILVGKAPSAKALAQAAAEAAQEAKPITDHRGSAEYRRLMVEVLSRRALEKALEQARGK